jgi:hypothetical protein
MTPISKKAMIGEKSNIDSMELLKKLDLLIIFRIGERTGSVTAYSKSTSLLSRDTGSHDINTLATSIHS